MADTDVIKSSREVCSPHDSGKLRRFSFCRSFCGTMYSGGIALLTSLRLCRAISSQLSRSGTTVGLLSLVGLIGVVPAVIGRRIERDGSDGIKHEPVNLQKAPY